MPSADATLIDQFPDASAVPVPARFPLASNSIVTPAVAVPVKVGVVMLVMLSVLDAPSSDAAVRSGVDAAAGGVVSMVTDKPGDFGLTLLPLLARAVKL